MHEPLPKAYAYLRPLEAELVKYFSNCFNAARIIFANQFYEVCESIGADYTAVKNAVAKRSNIGGHYLDCNRNFRAFGGACLPKDLSAFVALIKERNIDAQLFAWLLAENEKIKRKSEINDNQRKLFPGWNDEQIARHSTPRAHSNIFLQPL